MSAIQAKEILVALLCVAPFVIVGAGAVYVLLAGDPCEEAGE